jgi:hypothetical protein
MAKNNMSVSKALVVSNCTLIASKLNRSIDLDYLMSDDCAESEVRDLQDILIEEYNEFLKKNN